MPVYNACVGKRPPRSLLIRWALLATFCFQWTNVQGTHHDHSATPRDPAWLLGVNLDDIPNAPIRPVGSGVCPDAKCDGTDNEKCFENCAAVASASDVYGCPRDRHWALTFDDGPSALTASLLDVLDEYQVKATFCVLGAQVEKFPHLVKRAFLAGHQIASHTYSHPHLMSLTNEEIVYEMKATEKAIEAATGSRPRYMRPPYGEADARVKAIMRALGYKMLLWNVDPTDYKIHREPDAPELIEEVFYDIISGKSPSPNPHDDEGFISLQHDIFNSSVSRVPYIIDLLQENGFHFRTAAECVDDHEPHDLLAKPVLAQAVIPRWDDPAPQKEPPMEKIGAVTAFNTHYNIPIQSGAAVRTLQSNTVAILVSTLLLGFL